VLSAVALVDIENGDLTTAPLLPGRLCSADAIHLATALRLNARAMIVYDTGFACRIADGRHRRLRPGSGLTAKDRLIFRQGCAANPLQLPVSGLLGSAISVGYHLLALNGNRLLVAADWTLDALTGRQTTQLAS